MKEEILHFVWNHKLFNAKQLVTTDGETVRIVKQGYINNVAGPDFSEARLFIGNQEWSGSVEIHINSSDWNKHEHDSDANYNSVILHAVFNHDVEVKMQNGDVLKTLELKGLIPFRVINQYESLKASTNPIPCSEQIADVSNIVKSQWFDRLLIQRLERKSAEIFELLDQSNGDWLQAFYVLLAGYLGQNTNKQPFQELARAIPIKLLFKYQDHRFQLEALLFGVAGLIPKAEDEYAEKLKKEYLFLKQKHDLAEVLSQWKFGGVRPPAFPTRRIALLAALVERLSLLRDQLLSSENTSLLFNQIELSNYWKDRFQFGESSKRAGKAVADSLQNLIKINVFAPYIYAYANAIGDEILREKSVDLLIETNAETNAIIDLWQKIGVKSNNAADTQALIELKSVYCNNKKCVFCNIGKSIIARES